MTRDMYSKWKNLGSIVSYSKTSPSWIDDLMLYFVFQALKRALNLEPGHPEVHTCVIRFLQYRQEKLSGHNSVVVDVINKEVNRLLPTTDATQLNEDFLNDNQNSVPHRLQGECCIPLHSEEVPAVLLWGIVYILHPNEWMLVNIISIPWSSCWLCFLSGSSHEDARLCTAGPSTFHRHSTWLSPNRPNPSGMCGCINVISEREREGGRER